MDVVHSRFYFLIYNHNLLAFLFVLEYVSNEARGISILKELQDDEVHTFCTMVLASFIHPSNYLHIFLSEEREIYKCTGLKFKQHNSVIIYMLGLATMKLCPY